MVVTNNNFVSYLVELCGLIEYHIPGNFCGKNFREFHKKYYSKVIQAWHTELHNLQNFICDSS